MSCRACGCATDQFLSLGQQPLPNRFLTEAQITDPEPKYPLDLCFCPRCVLVQLGTVVPPEELFSNYLFASSDSPLSRAHFADLAARLKKAFHLSSNSRVADIASNDGILLRAWRDLGISAIGIEPAENLWRLAQNEGLSTINGFFTREVVDRIGPETADVITACNVFAHVDDIQSFTENVKRLLKPNGVFILEVQHLGAMVKTLSFDNVYLEHLSYFTLLSLTRFFVYQGMQVIDASLVPAHGGSLRLTTAREGAWPVSPAVARLVQMERRAGLRNLETFHAFAARVEAVREDLPRYLSNLDGRIIGYGAPAKASTLLNYCNIGPDTISYIVDDSPLKQGRYLPGMRIPITSPQRLTEAPPKYIILLAWNHAETIVEKTRHLGARYILPVPPRLVED